MDKLTIGKLAKVCGVTIDTIRYYERSKLLPAVARSQSDYRLYNEDSVRRVTFIKQAKILGFSLSEIRKLLRLKSAEDSTCAAMLMLTQKKIADTQSKIKELNRIEKALTKLAEHCPGGEKPISECPILDHLYPTI